MPVNSLSKAVPVFSSGRVAVKVSWSMLAGLLALAACCTASGAQVIGITDGDTLTVLDGQLAVKIRLANIDAPEKNQAFGYRAKRELSAICFAKQAAYVVQTRDRYGLAVATVNCDGIDAGRVMLERGMAWVYTKYNKDAALPRVEARAREAGRGLWAGHDAIAPWDFRRQRRGKPAP